MNILIVTSNRCGSIALAKWLQKELSESDPNVVGITYSIINNPPIDDNLFYKMDNSIVILLYSNYKKILKNKKSIPEENFDFTICLKRESTNQQAESYLWNNQKQKNIPYIINNNWIEENKKELQKLESEFKEEYDEMSGVFGYHATYESVFAETIPQDLWNIASYIGIRPKCYWAIKPTFKLRRFDSLKLL
jgi:hypothetical protein